VSSISLYTQPIGAVYIICIHSLSNQNYPLSASKPSKLDSGDMHSRKMGPAYDDVDVQVVGDIEIKPFGPCLVIRDNKDLPKLN
jgi:hypothetical protein